MSSYRSRSGAYQQSYHSNFYDEQSRSRSPSRRRSPPYDAPRDRSPHRRHRGSHDRRPSSRSRSRSSERPSSRGKPNKEVMLDELASHVTEKDIEYELKQHYNVHKLEDVRVIRDRNTRQSRGFAFIRFPTLEESEAFVDANYPTIYIYGESSKGNTPQDARIRISYGCDRNNNDRIQDADWICKVCNINNFSTRARCFRCQTMKPEAPFMKAANTGDNDAAPDSDPSQFLLFRGLEATTSEELFAKGVLKLTKPSFVASHSGQPPAKRSKVVSTTGDSNLGAREGSLRRILLVVDRRSGESWRYGFAEYGSIEDAQAALARYNSFDKFTIASKQVLATYIHAGVFIPATEVTADNERFFFSPLGNRAMKLAYWDQDAGISEFTVNVVEVQESVSKPATSNPAETEGLKPIQDDERSKKRKATDAKTPVVKKVTASHLQFWSNRHAELHGTKTKSTSSNSDTQTPKSYADPTRSCCYLCMRQFNTITEVNKHERLSKLHRDNLENEVKVKRAEHKMQKHRVACQASPTSQDDTPEYRDRARERREIYGVVNKKGEQVGGPKPAAETEANTGPPQPSKGAGLLAKMGYSAGSGLGASGSGLTAPLTQDVYAAGVGLGAQGGRLGDAVEQAEKNTKSDYGTWVEESRDKARERYSRM